MRGKKRSIGVLIKEVDPVLPSGPRPRWQEIDERLQKCARGVFGAFLEFAAAAQQAYDEKVWEHFGYRDPEPYFTERIRIAPRTFRRYLRVQGLLALLPPAERESGM